MEFIELYFEDSAEFVKFAEEFPESIKNIMNKIFDTDNNGNQ